MELIAIVYMGRRYTNLSCEERELVSRDAYDKLADKFGWEQVIKLGCVGFELKNQCPKEYLDWLHCNKEIIKPYKKGKHRKNVFKKFRYATWLSK
jgi:hypothetical protein